MSPPRLDILGIGTLAVDDLLYVEQYPPADAKMPVVRTARQFGGLVGTGLAAAARLGASCGYAGVLGSDELSAAMRGGMQKAGIGLPLLLDRADAGPVHSVIIVDQGTGTRNIFFDLQPMHGLGPGQVTPELIASAQVLLVDQFAMAGKLEATRLARRHGVPVVADLEWTDYPAIDEFMATVGHIIMPMHFAAEISGESDPAVAAERLHAACPRPLTAVTHGRDGCWFVRGEAHAAEHYPAHDVQTVETTGCGDVFHGAYAAGLAGGLSVPDCIALATAASGVYASRPSGWDQLPTRPEAEALLATRRS